MKPSPLLLRTALPALVLLFLAACEGPNRKAMQEEIRHSIPPMNGHEAFFGGDIIVDVQLGGNPDMAFGLKRQKEFNHSNRMLSGIGNNVLGTDMNEHAFGGAPVMGNSTVMDTQNQSSAAGEEGIGRNTHGTYQGNRDMNGTAEGEIPAPMQLNHDTEMPPAMMRLRIDNTTEAVMVVQIREVKSELGNFAIRPDELTLDPGKSAEVEPMVSMLGVESFSLPVSVTLRVGGQTESKVITLHVVPPDQHTPAPAPAPSAPPPTQSP